MEASAMARSLLSTPPPHPNPSLSRHRSTPEPLPVPFPKSQPRYAFPAVLSLTNPKSPASALGWERRGRFLIRFSVDGAVKTEEVVPIEKRFPPFPTVMDINQIRDILPHRFPFLLVDRVIEYQPGVTAVGIKNVTINDNFFPGHFPERPIMPGVLMVEAMAQVGGLVMLQPEVGGSRDNFFFAGIDKVRFRKPVIAGDTLVMRMTLIKLQKRFGIAKMEGKAYVGGDVVCEGEFLMATGSE
ncbi:uncharacterized protein [Elaeis guineensis]|uniref:3-hydroxyacyl-[acyl-carrier-protein] dehydratase n=1 Tax=Elaeis guineensis var. tenera TaxID=51953 RepID=A0A6I9QNL3_ELAGV|nr:uncharacterized protein LOC105038379 [Elaeis guineensis]